MKKEIITERFIFYFLLLIHIGYVWAIPVFLTQDGPSHLYNSKILLDIITDNSTEFYQQYLNVNFNIFPNWFSTVIISFLLFLFSPIIAEKIFISLLILTLPLTFRYALKTINPQAIFLSSLIFFLTNNYFLIYGFYNFQWSIIFFCLFVGLYFKDENTYPIKRSFKLSLLCLLIFFTHPVALIVILFLLGVDFTRGAAQFFTSSPVEKRLIANKLLHLMGIAFPSLLLFASYFFIQQSNGASIFEIKLTFHYFRNLIIPVHLLVFSKLEIGVLILFTLLLYMNVSYACFRFLKQVPAKVSVNLICLAFFCLFIYFFIGDKLAGGAYLTNRITIFFYVILILLAGTYIFPLKGRQVTLIGSFIIAISLLVIRYPIQKEIGQIAMEYIKIKDYLPNKVTVLPIGFSNKGEIKSAVLSPRLSVFKHISGYLGASGKYISFDNYEANTNYFPLIWKKEVNPYMFLSKNSLSGLELNPPSVDIVSFNKKSFCSVDYVVIWGDPARFLNSEKMKDLYIQLDKFYRLEHTSANHLTKIYVRQGFMGITKK